MTPSQFIEAARGYLFLNMPEDALAELTNVDAGTFKGPDLQDLQDLKLAAQMMSCRWNDAVTSSLRLCKEAPKNSRYFIHAAYCLHEIGDTLQAKKILLSGPKDLLEEPLFHYNMACYLSVLEKPDQAKHYLERAITLDPKLEQTAEQDEDLEPLFDS